MNVGGEGERGRGGISATNPRGMGEKSQPIDLHNMRVCNGNDFGSFWNDSVSSVDLARHFPRPQIP